MQLGDRARCRRIIKQLRPDSGALALTLIKGTD